MDKIPQSMMNLMDRLNAPKSEAVCADFSRLPTLKTGINIKRKP